MLYSKMVNRHVVPGATCCACRCQAHIPTMYHGRVDQSTRYLGMFPDQISAARAIADAIGCTLKDIKKPSCTRTSPSEQLDRVRVLLKVYQSELPGDLESAAQLRNSHADLVIAHPLLWSFVLRGKEGPWQSALLRTARVAFGVNEAWREDGAMASNETACCQFTDLLSPDEAVASHAARDFHELLVMSAVDLHGVDRSVWTGQVSSNVAHHSGWMSLLRFYKVLDKAGPNTTALCFRVDGPTAARTDYITVPYDAQIHLELYVSTARIVDMLRLIPLPTSLRDWSARDQKLVETGVRFERIMKCLCCLGKLRSPTWH
jgi:hypothetical protein